MKIYIAGAITGDPDYKRKFAEAEAVIASRFLADGATIMNPANEPGGLDQDTYMRLAFARISAADRVYFLPDWENSGGARLERAYCNYIGKVALDFWG